MLRVLIGALLLILFMQCAVQMKQTERFQDDYDSAFRKLVEDDLAARTPHGDKTPGTAAAASASVSDIHPAANAGGQQAGVRLVSRNPLDIITAALSAPAVAPPVPPATMIPIPCRAGQVPAGMYLADGSCVSMQYVGNVLSAICKGSSGPVSSSLDISTCQAGSDIVHRAGSLSCVTGTGFVPTCVEPACVSTTNLPCGASLTSTSGSYNAVMQTDGNFVLYDSSHKPLWASGTYGKGAPPYTHRMESDGNLVVYDARQVRLWASGTNGKGVGPYTVVMQDDGNLVVYDSTMAALWTSGTTQR